MRVRIHIRESAKLMLFTGLAFSTNGCAMGFEAENGSEATTRRARTREK